jgi:hypothetical protein
VEKCGRTRKATDHKIMRFICFRCWINKATDTHSEYVIFIAFPHQKWLKQNRFNVTFVNKLRVLFYIPSRRHNFTNS